ncbi:MAG: hypothetical protein ACI9U5_001005 [Colwellia sp.]|jgi:hypothetical protein
MFYNEVLIVIMEYKQEKRDELDLIVGAVSISN